MRVAAMTQCQPLRWTHPTGHCCGTWSLLPDLPGTYECQHGFVRWPHRIGAAAAVPR